MKTGREAERGALLFLAVNDGSGPGNLQVVVKSETYAELGELKTTGTSVVIEGELRAPPESAKGQAIELHATRVLMVGKCDGATYPIAKKKQTLEFLREKIHLRPRTNTIASVARVRSALAYATHTFFNQNGFLYVHTPCVTQSDCEGAGEMFQVTTLLSEAEKPEALEATVKPEEVEAKRAEVSACGGEIKSMKESGADSKEVKKAVKTLDKLKQELSQMESAARKIGGIQRAEDGSIDYSRDFFGGKSYLTVSGQLQVETYACALSNVYTFGPTFRAENSNTTRHLAEFWMIEPELAFADLNDDMQCAEDYVRFCCNLPPRELLRRLGILRQDVRQHVHRSREGNCDNAVWSRLVHRSHRSLGKSRRRRQGVRLPSLLGYRLGHRTRALARRGTLQETRDRLQLPEGHQGFLHALERRQQNRRRDGRLGAKGWRTHRR